MLAAAALVPETALLVPGASGRTPVLDQERAATVAAVVDLLAVGPDAVLVLVAAPRSSAAPAGGAPTGSTRWIDGPGGATLAAAGLDDDALGWHLPPGGWPATGEASTPAGSQPPTVAPQDGARGAVVDTVAAAVGLHLLERGGWRGAVAVLEVASDGGEDDCGEDDGGEDDGGEDDGGEDDGGGAALRAVGARLEASGTRWAVLACASLSARRGPGSPLAEDPRAEAFDDGVLTDLVDLGPASRDRLAAVDAATAASLAVSAWAPWQVLVGAAGAAGDPAGDRPLVGSLRRASVPLGATYAVVVWTRVAA